MTNRKAEKLEEQYCHFVELLKNSFPLEKISLLFVPDIMGYGANLDETIFNLIELHEGWRIQKEQSVGLDIQFEFSPVSRRISHQENVAIYVDEIRIMMTIDGVRHENVLRLSIIFEFIDVRWLCTHFHASRAIDVEGDAWATDLSKKKNEELQRMVDERTIQLQNTIHELKSTQAQLIQSEKMASLGQLTAGIAHEIQNPLNFVNNFSELSSELIDEMKDEFKKGDTEEGFTIADDIKQNLEKITYHGKRADAIVKGMLQHSRSNSGTKELTDINALADEYLRLSYHGLRTKDKSFNATFETDFDSDLPKINVVPQDMGRVLLNLINNAFQAVHERSCEGEKDFKPEIIVSTKTMRDKVQISVKDNGSGIPDAIKDKIFQPFFTTKPTGQGTGLGLSLSYDIVKAHGGTIEVEILPAGQAGVEREGTTFIIILPIKTI